MAERILVTGAGGFLGSHICNYFGQRGHIVAAVDRLPLSSEQGKLYPNLKNFHVMSLPDRSFARIIRELQPGLLVHCAGIASVPYSMKEPYDDFQQSAGVTAFILETLRKHMPSCHFIFLSSAAVYGNPQKLPIDEKAPCQPISPYGYHKYICELLCHEYQSIYKMKCSMLRIFSAYGERLRKQLIFDLCNKFTDPSAKSVEVYGTGNETRDFIHAADIVRSVELIHDANAAGVFNVASGIQTRVSEVAEMIKTSLKSRKKISYSGASRPGDPLHWQADIAGLSSFGFLPATSLSEGIKKYCKWFKSGHRVNHDRVQ